MIISLQGPECLELDVQHLNNKTGVQPRYWHYAVVACLCLLIAIQSFAKGTDEYTIKLVYLYNFTKFVEWPSTLFKDDQTPFSICIMGSLPSTESAKQLENKTSKNRTIDIRLLNLNSKTDSCHILFLTKTLKGPIATEITQRAHQSTIVVGETPNFANHSGEIGFILDDQNRVRVEINLLKAQQKNISIKSPLLEIARKVYRGEENT